MLKRNSYVWAGLGLLVAGAVVFAAAYFILNATWLTAFGICMLILAFILLALGRTIPSLPPEVCSLLLETGVDNIASLVEELGIKAKAMYLPSSLAAGRPQALIPLHSSPALPRLTQAVPRRLIVRFGTGPDDVGLLLSTAGTTAVGMLSSRPEASSAALEEALTTLFSGTLGVADGVRVTANHSHVGVAVRGARLEQRAGWSDHCLGGPLASIVASVVAEAWDKPVVINKEGQEKGEYRIELEVVS